MPQPRQKPYQHTATIRWSRGKGAFAAGQFSRAHTWAFDGGLSVPASSSPHVVRVPFSRTDAIDPEEALVAAAASCHMMTFLYLAAKDGLCVDDYADDAAGELTPNAAGKLHIARITLTPRIAFSGNKRPTQADIAHLHERAHADCYIANSIRAEVVVQA